jgi:hypothetical protein
MLSIAAASTRRFNTSNEPFQTRITARFCRLGLVDDLPRRARVAAIPNGDYLRLFASKSSRRLCVGRFLVAFIVFAQVTVPQRDITLRQPPFFAF